MSKRLRPLRLPWHPPTMCPREAHMSFTLRPYRRFPVQCAVTYNAGPFKGQGTIWNLSMYRVATLR